MRLQWLLTARTAGVLGATAIAGAVTLANRAGWIALRTVAASPYAIAKGKVWLLFTSGVIADRPWVASLVGFAIVAFAVLSVASLRVVVISAFAGHVLATLAVYGALGLARQLDPDHDAFASLVHKPDYGLSAIIAAWIGVVAQWFWRRYRSPRAHVLNVLGCIGCALIGFAFRPDVTALDTEHLVAFAMGVAIAAWWPTGASLDSFSNSDVDRELQQMLERTRMT
jgi:hypothetical protein